MRKFMNNHYGQSIIFRHARFKAPVDGGTEGATGGGSGGVAAPEGDETDTDEVDDNNSDDIDSLKAELARAKAEARKFKNTNDKLLKEKGELTKKNREMMSVDQLEKEAQEERDKKFAEMAKELRVNRYSKRLVGLGMTESDADEFAATIPEMEDSDAFFSTLNTFIQAKVKEASDNAVQDFLKSRPEINAGNGDSDKDTPAMELAKRSVEARKAVDANTSNNIIKYYTH